MGETCSMYGRVKYIYSTEILKERYSSVELSLNGWIIIQQTSNKSD
jgi:hypothetical protein